jgi:hypothetical protein
MHVVRNIALAACLIFALATPLHAASRVEFILDVSGSMNKFTSGEKRIDLARKAMAAAVASIPDGSIVALRLYSHRIPHTQREQSCKDTELVVPFGPINKQQIIDIVNRATPLGETPIAYSLEQAALDFPTSGDEQPVIILVSDGEESCGGDPVAVANGLLAKGFKVKIHTIGLDVDPAAQAQLQAISTATGGQYKDARDAAGLTSSLQQLTQESLLVKKETSVYGQPIRGGSSYETAVPLVPGQQYRLDHHQRKNEFDYFYVDVKDGQKLEALLETGSKGVSISGQQLNEQVRENNAPYAGIQIHSPQRENLTDTEIIGNAADRKTLSVPTGVGQGGRYYVLVGSTYDHQHKDHPFKVSVIDLYDAGTTVDAGDKEAQAIEIQTGMYPKNHLHGNDRVDMFKFKAAPGVSYAVKARPTSEQKRLEITIKDADGVELIGASSPNPGAVVKIDQFGSVKGGDLFIRLASYYSDEVESDYSLELTAGAGAPAPAEGAPQAQAAPPAQAPVTATAPTARQEFAIARGVQTDRELRLLLHGLPLWEQIKWYLTYSGIPLAAGWLIGMIWGYVKGRKKRKASS